MPLILAFFFGSGATALVYEVLWSKYLALLLGSTVQAQTVVLAVFMGGLALGNRLFGRWARGLQAPLAVYGRLELAIGLYAFAFPQMHRFADGAFVTLGTPWLGQPLALLGLKAGLSTALLLGPTILMGGTLPLVAEWLRRGGGDAARATARFYAVNTLGAVAGAWLAGFVLVTALGLAATVQATAFVNLLIGLAAIVVSRVWRAEAPAGSLALPAGAAEGGRRGTTASESDAPHARIERGAAAWGGLIVAVTGGIAMALEVVASRALILVFGASLQAFAVVLIAFILGIGLGGSVVASPRWRTLKAEPTTAVLLLGAAVLVGLFMATLEQWVDAYRLAQSGLARSTMGYRFHTGLTALLAIGALGLPAGLIGAVLPLWIRREGAGHADLAEQVGRLLTWNTCGAVVGALLMGFVLMPGLGLRGAIGACALVLAGSALLVAWRSGGRGLAGCGAVVLVGLVTVLATGGERWKLVMSAGLFRLRETEVVADALDNRSRHVKLLFYEDGTDASVSVEQGDGVGMADQLTLRVNGKADASTKHDLGTQLLLAHLPMLARPASQDVFVFGLGSGITAGAFLGHPVRQIVVAENCAPVLRAAPLFAPWNRGVLTNARVRIVNDDARTVLKLSPQTYDLIVSEPSNPWMAGVGSVFSREFYELAARRLKPGGLMVQWFQLYEINDAIVALVFRTFNRVFPHLEVWDVGYGDVVLIGAQQPWTASLADVQAVFERAEPRRDLEAFGLKTPASVLVRRFASQGSAFAIAGDGPLQTDAFPVLEYEAPRAFYLGQGARTLLRFDERTWQSELLPMAEFAAMRDCPDDTLAATFDALGSINGDLLRFVRLRTRLLDTLEHLNQAFDHRPPPGPFRRPESLEAFAAPLPPEASPELRQLREAAALLAIEPERWQDPLATILRILEAAVPPAARPVPQPGSGAEPKRDWASAYYSTLAARVALRHDAFALATRALIAGRALDPKSEDLDFLDRVLAGRAGPPYRTQAGPGR